MGQPNEAPGHALAGELTLYVRRGCHLCVEAEAVLAPLLQEAGRRVRRVEITDDPEAARRFGLRIPVLTCQAREICSGRFRADALRTVFGLPPPGHRGPRRRRPFHLF